MDNNIVNEVAEKMLSQEMLLLGYITGKEDPIISNMQNK